MSDLFSVACGTGLRDGLNPCIFMACAVFIAHGLWLKRRSLKSGWPRIIFVLVYASGFLAFNFGPAQVFLFRKEFVFAAGILYLGLGVWAFVAGLLFLKDWVSLHRAVPQKDEFPLPKAGGHGRGNWGVVPTTVLLGLVLSALATLWPIDNYMMLLGNGAILKGQWRAVMPLLTEYIFSSMWPLLLVWAFLSIKNLRPSLLKIFYAFIFFTASSCVVFILKDLKEML